MILKILLSILGGYHYLHVGKPSLNQPLEVLMNQNDYVSKHLSQLSSIMTHSVVLIMLNVASGVHITFHVALLFINATPDE